MPSPNPRWLPPLIVLLTGLLMFSSTWSDSVQVADSGEVISAACNLGVSHPPGYPLSALLGHGLCQLPWSTPAGRVGLLSLLAGLWTLLALYGVVVRVTGNAVAAMIAALVLATGDIFWRYSSQAEVFTLNTALALSVVYCAVRAQAARDRAQLFWSGATGLCMGLALSNHHSSIWIFPLALVAVALPLRPLAASGMRLVAAVVGGTLGLLPYLHLLLADPLVIPRWGETGAWSGLVHHVLRRDYGTLSLTLGGEWAPLENLWHLVSRIPSQTAWLLWPVGLLGMAVLCYRWARRPLGEVVRPRLRRDVAVALALSPVLAGPGFMLLFNIKSTGVAGQVAERFFMLPVALLCVCVGIGLAQLHQTFLEHQDAGPRRKLWYGVAALVLVLAAMGSCRKADLSENYVVEDFAVNSLSSVERGALIIGTGDVRLFSFMYTQHVLGVRPDVQYIDAYLMLYPWYVKQKKRQRPRLSYEFTRGNVNTLGLIRREMGRGVPVYLASVYNKKVLKAFRGYPVGPLIRLYSPTIRPPDKYFVEKLNRRLFKGYSRRGRLPARDEDPWGASLRITYAGAWRSLARIMFITGDRKTALRCLARAHHWAPWLESPRWFKQQPFGSKTRRR